MSRASGLLLRNIFLCQGRDIRCVVLCLLMCMSSVARAGDPDIAMPPNARTSWVSSDMQHNGNAMTIRTFAVNQSVEDVLEFYRKQWQASSRSLGYVEDTVNNWRIISMISQHINTVLQLQADVNGHSRGFLSTQSLSSTVKQAGHRIPLPPGSTTVSRTDTVDGDRQAQTTVLIASTDSGSTASFYRRSLVARGWSITTDTIQQDQPVLMFNRAEETCEIVISVASDRSTIVLLNCVNSHE